jgi:IS5 family transposase
MTRAWQSCVLRASLKNRDRRTINLRDLAHYGHKVFLSVGESGMILDLLMERGNPADVTRAIPMLERHRALSGKAPEQVAFDAGFTSSANGRHRAQVRREECFLRQEGLH